MKFLLYNTENLMDEKPIVLEPPMVHHGVLAIEFEGRLYIRSSRITTDSERTFYLVNERWKVIPEPTTGVID